MGQRHGRRPEHRRVGEGEIDLVLGRHSALERHAVSLGNRVAVAMLDKVESFLFGQRRSQIGGLADQAGLALLANAAPEHRLDEDDFVAADQVLNLVLARIRTQHFRGGEIHVSQ